MQVIHALEEIPNSPHGIIFLAGPSPRNNNVPSWRPDALELLKECNFQGVVLVPEQLGEYKKETCSEQVEWEHEGLEKADVILFWLCRDMKTLPGLTTNDEWGTYKKSGKVVLGVPPTAQRYMYQIFHAEKNKVPIAYSLDKTIQETMMLLSEKLLEKQTNTVRKDTIINRIIDTIDQVTRYFWTR